MRIVSKLKDYYDSVQGMGQDLETDYIRTPKTITGEELSKPFWKIPCFRDTYWFRSPSLLTTGYTIGFCGKIYKLVHVEHNGKEKFCYSAADVASFVEANFKSALVESFKTKQYSKHNKWHGTRLFEYEKWLVPPENDNFQRVFEYYRCPIWVYHSSRNDSWLEVNSLLNQYQFQRVFDPYSAFQEIYMYLCNQAHPVKELPHIDDVTMAEAKGFNKYSFRKDKTNG